jgi:hypothetical protein
LVSFTPLPLYPKGKNPGIHWIGGWVGPGAGLNAVMKRNIPSLCQDSNPRSYSPYPRAIPLRYAIPAHHTMKKTQLIFVQKLTNASSQEIIIMGI